MLTMDLDIFNLSFSDLLVHITMSAIKELQSILQNNDDGWIELDVFAVYLRKHILPGDKMQRIYLSSLKRHRDCRIIGGRSVINVASVLKYIFMHDHELSLCRNVADYVTHLFIGTQTLEGGRIDLYNRITNDNITDKYLYSITSPHVTLNSSNVGTLSSKDVDYEKCFTADQWKLILLFEHHFTIACPNYHNMNPTEQDQERWKYYHQCIKAKDFATDFQLLCSASIAHHDDRMHTTALHEGMHIFGYQQHIPLKIDQDIQTSIQTNFEGSNARVVTVDHTNSYDDNSILVFIENDHQMHHHTRANHVAEVLENKHNLRTKTCIYLKSGTFDKYMEKAGKVARFRLRDDYLFYKLTACIVFQWEPDSYYDLPIPCDHSKCSSCYPSLLAPPLHIRDFDILSEWVVGIPLPIQIIFEKMINKEVLYCAKDKERYLRKKLNRAYLLFHALLNILNKNFIGILQTATTDELIMNYKSVNTVFDITNSAGITLSLSTAERLIHSNALDDQQYFETFLKTSLMQYQTDVGFHVKPVNLRMCKATILIDNLVRLLQRTDPKPGR